MILRLTVRYMSIAALLSSAAVHAYAQPAAPIASDAALMPTLAAPAPIPADIALPNVIPPAPQPPSNVIIAPALPLNPAPLATPQMPANVSNPAGAPPAPGALPEQSANEEPVVTEQASLNFDAFGSSLFYKPQDINKLKAALDIADAIARKAAMGATKIEEAIMPLMPEPPKIEISEYPVFHLSSIMYQGAGKWVIWLNGNRTTSKSLPPDLKVVGINTQNARFEWKPQIFPALETRWKSEEGDASKTNLKKLLSGNNLVSVDSKTASITFNLRPNQTYSSAYNAVLEGKQAAVNVTGDSGVIDINAFEQTMRENQQRNEANNVIRNPNVNGVQNRLPRVVRPGNNAGMAAQPGAATLGNNQSTEAVPSRRRSGLVNPDASTIGQVPVIFPGGVPEAARAMPRQPEPVDAGLPILPSGGQ